MTPEELNTASYHKMEAEQDSYRDWLLTLPPDEILQHAYEYAVRQDILFAMEDLELQPEQCQHTVRRHDTLGDPEINEVGQDHGDTRQNPPTSLDQYGFCSGKGVVQHLGQKQRTEIEHRLASFDFLCSHSG